MMAVIGLACACPVAVMDLMSTPAPCAAHASR